MLYKQVIKFATSYFSSANKCLLKVAQFAAQLERYERAVEIYEEVSTVSPKFSDTRKLCYNLPEIQDKKQNLWAFHQKDANGIANSEDPDQTAPLGAV